MERDIQEILITEEQIKARIQELGKVLTEEYANKIGADKYAKDAMDAVRYAEEFIKNN